MSGRSAAGLDIEESAADITTNWAPRLDSPMPAAAAVMLGVDDVIAVGEGVTPGLSSSTELGDRLIPLESACGVSAEKRDHR